MTPNKLDKNIATLLGGFDNISTWLVTKRSERDNYV